MYNWLSVYRIMSTLWMLGILSSTAKYCRGFRSLSLSSMTLPISPVRSYRFEVGGFFNLKARSYEFQDSSRVFIREAKGFYRCNNSRMSMSSQISVHDNLITSPKSQTVKKVQALLSKRKQRLRHGQTVVEGPRMVFDLLDNPRTAHLVRQVLVSARDYERRDDYRARLFGSSDNVESSRDNVLVQLVHPEVFPHCTDTITPQGIVAVVDIPEAPSLSVARDEITESLLASAPMYLVLDGVSDPGNLGTLLRTSLAVGVAGVILLPGCCDVWNPKAVRSAMGASFQVPVLEAESWEVVRSELGNVAGVETVYAATMIEEEEDGTDDESSPRASLPYFDIDWTRGPSALIIGSEGNGLSPMIRRDLVRRKNERSIDDNGEDDVTLGATHIPMGAGIESLNAAVCGSVILFEYARQCQRSP